MLPALFHAVAFGALLAVAQVERQIVLPNHSPTIVYQPYGDGFDPANGWTIWTSGAGFVTEGGQLAEGDIFHITARQGASFTLGFHGTGISLSGTSNATYQVVVDGTVSQIARDQDVLFTIADLELKSHVVTLEVLSNDASQLLSFGNATIATRSPERLQSTVYPSNSSEVQYTGEWYSVKTPEGTWMETKEYHASAAMEFSGARTVAIHSPLNFGHWNYSIEIDGQTMLPPGDGTPAFNASTWWLISDSILYYADNLDEGEHTIKIIHLANEEYWRSTFTSFEVWRPDASGSGSPSSPSDVSPTDPSTRASESSDGLSTGAYVGIGVGAFAVVIITAVAVWFILRRWRHRGQPRYNGHLIASSITHDARGTALPSQFLSNPTSQLPVTASGGIQPPVLVYERHHNLPLTSSSKGDRTAWYAPIQGAPAMDTADSPVMNDADAPTTEEALQSVGSPPPAYGDRNVGHSPRS